MKTQISILRNTILRGILYQFKTEIGALFFLSSIVNLFMLVPTFYMLQVYDRVMISQSELTLLVISLITLTFYIIQSASEQIRSKILIGIGIRLEQKVNDLVFRATMRRQLSGPGFNPTQTFTDLTTVRHWLTGNTIFNFFDLPWSPFYILIMFLLHPFLGWLTILFIAILGFFTWVSGYLLRDRIEDLAEEERQTNAFMYSKLRNAEVLSVLGMFDNLFARWLNKHKQMMVIMADSRSYESAVTALGKGIRLFLQSLALAAGALLAMKGEISLGAMIAASLLIGRATSPIDGILAAHKSTKSIKIAIDRLTELFTEFGVSSGIKHQLLELSEGIFLEDVKVFVPGRDEPILDVPNLRFQPGSVYAIIGPSGAGKSTLGKVVIGAILDHGGSIFYDKLSKQHLNKDEVGHQFGYLPQSIELFPGTVAENIARMGKIDSSLIIQAASTAGCHEMIQGLPNGYDTLIGNGGSTLSGGQRQRIGLARAIYGQPKLIVLDEPNSNLDKVGEDALAKCLLEVRAYGAIVLVITHRPSLLAQVDYVALLGDGKINAFDSKTSFFAKISELKNSHNRVN